MRLADEQMDLKYNLLDIQKSLGEMRIKVYRRVHVQAKIADDDKAGNWLPLGEDYRTNRMNFTIKPVDCPVGSYDWSKFPTIPCTKVVVFQGKQHKITEQLQYTVGGDSLVDAAETQKYGETCFTICNGLYGCKQLRIVCRGECARKRRAETSYRSAVKEARQRTASYAAARKEVRRENKEAYEQDKAKAKAMIRPSDSDSDAGSSSSQTAIQNVKCPFLTHSSLAASAKWAKTAKCRTPSPSRTSPQSPASLRSAPCQAFALQVAPASTTTAHDRCSLKGPGARRTQSLHACDTGSRECQLSQHRLGRPETEPAPDQAPPACDPAPGKQISPGSDFSLAAAECVCPLSVSLPSGHSYARYA